jgi:hypothetical protein
MIKYNTNINDDNNLNMKGVPASSARIFQSYYQRV